MTESNRSPRPVASYEDCGHLVWQESPEADAPAPGPYCLNPRGIFPLLDCPLFQGRACSQFSPRPPGKAPAVRSKAELEAISHRLAEDYLTRRYWHRVGALVANGPGGGSS